MALEADFVLGYNLDMKELLRNILFMLNMILMTVIIFGALDNIFPPTAREIYDILEFVGAITLSQFVKEIVASHKEPGVLLISLLAVVWAMYHLDQHTKTRLTQLKSIIAK